MTDAITMFFTSVVTAALDPMLELLSSTLLTTPSPQEVPRLGELWASSWQILVASYGLLVLVAAIVVMSFETLQARYTIKEIGPRLVIGFLAGALSLWAATRAVEIANGVSHAVMGEGLDAAATGAALRDMTLNSLSSGIVPVLIGLFVVVMLVGLLVGYVIRVALTVILIAGAPIALMFHALPHTEPIAYWWWKALAGCLGIQIVQSLTLITAIRVFLTPGGFTPFGPTSDGLVNLIVVAALMYILFKIPSWILGSVRGGGGRRSVVGSLLRGFIAYKTFGLLPGRGGRRSSGTRPTGPGGAGASTHAGPDPYSPDPYSGARATADGQYLLPLRGLRRTRTASTQPTAPARTSAQPAAPAPANPSPANPSPANPSSASPTPQSPGPSASPPRHGRGRQLALPLGDDWPENRPVLGRDGQYRLPLDGVRRIPRPADPPPAPARARPRTGVQLRLPLDLPRPAPPAPPAAPSPTGPRPAAMRPPAPPPPAAPNPPASGPRRSVHPADPPPSPAPPSPPARPTARSRPRPRPTPRPRPRPESGGST